MTATSATRPRRAPGEPGALRHAAGRDSTLFIALMLFLAVMIAEALVIARAASSGPGIATLYVTVT